MHGLVPPRLRDGCAQGVGCREVDGVPRLGTAQRDVADAFTRTERDQVG